MAQEGWGEFDLPPEGMQIRDEAQAAALAANDLKGDVERQSVGVSIPTGQFIMFVTAIVLMIGLRHLVMKTQTGRAMRAVSHDFDAASLMGVNVNRIVAITFVIGSSLAGAGAMMNATVLGTQLSPFYGLIPGVKAFVAAVLGGIGNIPGAVLGGLIMGVAEGLVVWAGYSSLKDAIAFVILIVILLLRPGGLLGSSAVEKV
jgi:branched-chain amino acid transport system permease protein